MNSIISKKVTNWNFPLCLPVFIFIITINLLLNWWYLYILVYIFFISISINILFPLFNQRRMINIVCDGNKVLNKKFIYFFFLSLCESCFKIKCIFFWISNFLLVFATEEVALFFYQEKSVSSWSITLILNFTSFRILFCCLESFSII